MTRDKRNEQAEKITEKLWPVISKALGGRPVTRDGIRSLVEDVLAGRVSDHALTFPDLDVATVSRELAREGAVAEASLLEGTVHRRLGSLRPVEEAGA